MSRKIIIDYYPTGEEDTYIGYDFIKKRYYIGNKGTETYRSTSVKAKQVLDVVAPFNEISVETIQGLENNTEVLTDLYYTLSDEGDCVKTIQLNDYVEHPIVLDLPRRKMYIMNSELVFDLTLNEGRAYRSGYIASYFKEYIGFGEEEQIQEGVNIITNDIFEKKIEGIYDFLMQYYEPTVYNQVSLESIQSAKNGDGALKYSNVFGLTNYNGKGVAEYICTLNPNSDYTPVTINGISVMQANSGLVALANPIGDSIKVGDEVLISGSQVEDMGVTYSNDGRYTVASVDLNPDMNSITLTTPLKIDYVYPYYELYLVNGAVGIASISHTNSTITLNSACPSIIEEGIKIWIFGTTQTIDHETISVDGEYLVTNISSDRLTLTVAERPKYDFTYSSGSVFIYKESFLSGIESVVNNVAHLMDTITPLTTGTSVKVKQGDTLINWNHILVDSTSTSVTLNSDTYINWLPSLPALQKDHDVDVIEINVTETSDTSDFPVGVFNVDNFVECVDYISTMPYIKVPTEVNKNSIGQPLPATKHITYEEYLDMDMKSLGVYSMVYDDSNLKS
jgi:hypothetical protein